MRRAFTLVEILVVIGVLALLAALIFPVFAQARARGRQTVCSSHLQQLGQAIALYSSDFERFPRGLDPADKFTPQIWQHFPGGLQIMNETPLLTEVLAPYVKDGRLWQCAADTGFDVSDTTGLALDARPTCYKKFGMSYFYRTELMLREKAAEDLPFPAQTHVLADGAGSWHGSNRLAWHDLRYNVLFADVHVKNLSKEQYDEAWGVSVQ